MEISYLYLTDSRTNVANDYTFLLKLMYKSGTDQLSSHLEEKGEMAQAIKAFDWSVTPLGPIQLWPPSLTNPLDSLLHADYPQFLVWDNEYSFFCNDAFNGLVKPNLSGLATHAVDVWPALWTVVQPQIDLIRKGGPAGLLVDSPIPVLRAGVHRAAYWTLTFSRIKDEHGAICGVLVTCLETTARVLSGASTTALQAVLDACELGTWELDPATMTFSCNEKTQEIFGLPQNDNIRLEAALNETIVGADRAKVSDAVLRALQPSSGGRYDVTYSIVNATTGKTSIIRSKGKAYFDDAGNPIRFTGTNQDITADELARRRKEKLQLLVENAKDYMSMATLDGRLTYLNTAGRLLVGLDTTQGISSLGISDFYSADQSLRIKTEILPAMERDGHWSGMVNIRHQQTGEQIPCYANFALVYDTITGQAIARAATLRDLRPELIARKELEESEKRFRNLVQEAPVATAIYIGREMKVQWANDAMIKLWGKDKSAVGKTVRQALPELEGQPFHGLLDRVFTTGEMYQGTEDRGDLVIDGVLQTFYFNFSYKPLRDTNGEVYGILNMAIDVTEQVKVKRRLEESETNFRNLIMQAPVGICLLTGDDFVVEVTNDNYLELIGKSRELVQNRPIWDVLPEAKAQGFDKLLSGVKEIGQPFFGNEHEVVLIRNGQPETLYVNFVYEPLLDEHGKTHSVLVIAIDITPQVTARQLIKEAADRARIAVESANLGSYEVNVSTQEVIGTPRFNELFDFDETSGRNDYVRRIHPDDLPARQAAHSHALKTGKLEYEARVNRRDGTQNWIQAFGQYYFDEAGQPVRIIGVVRDITRQKLAEEEREKFLSVTYYSRDFIGLYDLQLKTLFVNKAGTDMLGLDDNVVETSLWGCFFPEDQAYLQHQFFPQVIREEYGETEIRFRHVRTHQPIWVIYSAFIIHDGQGKPSGIATICRDITERKTMEAELERRVKERTAELERLNDELQQFTFVSSHDLKEPLRKIQLFAGLAQQEADQTNTALASYLGKVRSSASRMSGLLTDLLNYSMLSNTERTYETVDLNSVIQRVLDDNELLIQEKQALVSVAHLPTIEGVTFQLNQLFHNLVNNALKFNQAGKPVSIQIHSAVLSADEKLVFELPASETYYRIDVIDNGIGFREEFAGKIFVVFQRLNDRTEYAGNGIGLSICKKIVENHQGRIMASSTPGEGATFTILFPQKQV